MAAAGERDLLYQGRIRVHGVGRWHRDEQGAWHLDRFKIETFEVLDGSSIRETVDRLRAIPGASVIYSDDEDMARFGPRADLKVIATAAMPLPPGIAQGSLGLGKPTP